MARGDGRGGHGDRGGGARGHEPRNRGVQVGGVPRRPGDIAECYADPGAAHQELDWRAEKDLTAMCEDTWRWQQQKPAGYS